MTTGAGGSGLNGNVSHPEPAPDDPVHDLLRYLNAAPTPFHAVDESARRFLDAGFREVTDIDLWPAAVASKPVFVRRGGALIAWKPPAKKLKWTEGVSIVGAHTDSPNLRIKPHAVASAAGYDQVPVEIYGGILNNSWLDRDLCVAGRLVLDDGSSVHVSLDRPVARVAQLAVHLDREVNDRGLVLDKQLHLLPFSGMSGSQPFDESAKSAHESFVDAVARRCGIDPSKVVAHDLMFHDATPAALIGLRSEFVASGRIDNLFSCWAATEALIGASSASQGQIVALFDHEEVGSSSTTGAAGPLLERVLDRVFHAAGLHAEERAVALARSNCVSSDMAHAVHPNYSDRHEPGHRPIPNGGPVIKSNANQRYASTADTAARFAAACTAVDVPVQWFVSKNSMPCGSTIGPITATRLGIDTVDIGCAMLSMHSARELCGSADASLLVRALISFFSTSA
jgi:aspartyl aminopeptidase